jgi:L-gulonolactone oxidase
MADRRSGHRWENWARDEACRPAVRLRPTTVGEVAASIESAAVAGRTVRVAGAGHSSNDSVLTDGTLLSLERMHRVLDLDRESGLVRVEAGITLHALSELLWDHGLALQNLGDIDVQSVAGAIATGTHGTGIALGNISARVAALELVLADGSALELSEASDPEAMRAARVGLGALGAVTAVTLRTVPSFVLDFTETSERLDAVLDSLDERVTASERFGFFTFPYTRTAMTRTANRVEGAPRTRTRGRAWFDDIFMTNHVYHAICRAGRARPSLVPGLNRLVGRLAGTTHRVDRSYLVLATPRRVPFTEMEWAVPRASTAAAVSAVLEMIERERFPVSFPLEVRFGAADDAFLSPAAGRETGYVTVHMFGGMEWEPFFRAVEETAAPFGARPHWGKRHFRTAGELRGLYPDWDRFAAVRERLDPDGRFENDYVRRMLGPHVGARAGTHA